MSAKKPRTTRPPAPTAVFTIFTGGPNQVLTKTITLDEDGKLSKVAPQHAGSGHVETVRLPLSELSDYLGAVTKNQCLIHGTSKEGDNGPVKVVVDAARRDGDDTISRTKDFFEYPAGPCLSMLDYDPNPENGHDFDPEELIEAIDELFPGFAGVATVAALSTSSEVYLGEELKSSPGKPGFHLYFVAKDGRDLPRFGKVLFKRLWLAGHGYSKLSRGDIPKILRRAPIDTAVFGPERCDFSAGAVREDGLTQQRPLPVFRPGGYLDTSLLPDLTPEEDRLISKLLLGILESGMRKRGMAMPGLHRKRTNLLVRQKVLLMLYDPNQIIFPR